MLYKTVSITGVLDRNGNFKLNSYVAIPYGTACSIPRLYFIRINKFRIQLFDFPW